MVVMSSLNIFLTQNLFRIVLVDDRGWYLALSQGKKGHIARVCLYRNCADSTAVFLGSIKTRLMFRALRACINALSRFLMDKSSI